MTRPVSRFRPVLLLAPCLLLGCSTVPHDDAGVLAIGAVQGREARSARVGQGVVVEGTVTALRRDGWFVQDGGDGDDATSDALFVREPGAAVQVGERVRVRGSVAEETAASGTRTVLERAQVERLGAGTGPEAVTVDRVPADWEALEGMRVRIDAPLLLADAQARAKDGRVLASLDGRLWQPTERATPGSDAWKAVVADNARRGLWLESTDAAPAPEALDRVRAGSRLAGTEGILDEAEVRSDATRRLLLSSTPDVHPAPRPSPPQVAGDVRIAALNLENLFNGDGRGGDFPTPRGARTPQELQAQLAKHVATIRTLDADVVALMELENDGYGPQSSIATLVSALGAPWRFVDAGEGPGDNAIRVGLVYRGDRVRTQGRPATLEGGPLGPESRVPLAQAFVPVKAGRDDGAAFVVVANHFKSKGCSKAMGDDRDLGDGASCYNAARVESARRVHDWLATDPTGHGRGHTLIVGDLNAYAREAPVRTLIDAGWRDAFEVAGIAEPYSYAWDGRIGRLDHALLSPGLAARLRGAAEWHGNADEPEASGYRAGGDGPWRSSDHDPLLLGFELRRSR
ncbi:MAG TPA: ExeM/NucH family extracellular endonuclease [Lysobacter sp.]